MYYYLSTGVYERRRFNQNPVYYSTLPGHIILSRQSLTDSEGGTVYGGGACPRGETRFPSDRVGSIYVYTAFQHRYRRTALIYVYNNIIPALMYTYYTCRDRPERSSPIGRKITPFPALIVLHIYTEPIKRDSCASVIRSQ